MQGSLSRWVVGTKCVSKSSADTDVPTSQVPGWGLLWGSNPCSHRANNAFEALGRQVRITRVAKPGYVALLQQRWKAGWCLAVPAGSGWRSEGAAPGILTAMPSLRWRAAKCSYTIWKILHAVSCFFRRPSVASRCAGSVPHVVRRWALPQRMLCQGNGCIQHTRLRGQPCPWAPGKRDRQGVWEPGGEACAGPDSWAPSGASHRIVLQKFRRTKCNYNFKIACMNIMNKNILLNFWKIELKKWTSNECPKPLLDENRNVNAQTMRNVLRGGKSWKTAEKTPSPCCGGLGVGSAALCSHFKNFHQTQCQNSSAQFLSIIYGGYASSYNWIRGPPWISARLRRWIKAKITVSVLDAKVWIGCR